MKSALAPPGGNHGQHQGLALNGHVQHHGQVLFGRLGPGPGNGLGKLFGGGHLAPQPAEGLGHPRIGGRLQVGLGLALVQEHLLPLANHAQEVVVEDQDHQAHLVAHRRGQLLDGHKEGAVAVDEHHFLVRRAHLGPHRGGQAEAHGAQAAGGDQGAGLFKGIELGGVHLVLAHAGDHDGLLGQGLAPVAPPPPGGRWPGAWAGRSWGSTSSSPRCARARG